MFRKFTMGVVCAAALAASSAAAFAQAATFGTAAEAKAMLEKAVAG